jgi:small multidrug resistance pump
VRETAGKEHVVPWLLVATAIAAELTGTLGLRQLADTMTWWNVLVVVLAYAASFTCLGLALRQLDVGVVYALWSGIGTAATSVAGAAIFGERLSWQAIAGLAVIVAGVCVLLTSGTVHHGRQPLAKVNGDSLSWAISADMPSRRTGECGEPAHHEKGDDARTDVQSGHR